MNDSSKNAGFGLNLWAILAQAASNLTVNWHVLSPSFVHALPS